MAGDLVPFTVQVGPSLSRTYQSEAPGYLTLEEVAEREAGKWPNFECKHVGIVPKGAPETPLKGSQLKNTVLRVFKANTHPHKEEVWAFSSLTTCSRCFLSSF
ncbi:hypothetical protein WJX73_000797 [Symbiochloris irregularis]|uniref:Uncharacterized protein n=1 Tax=Symbiochloris irregularis TaxID=706552 RepID=A0AAW1PS52_9CHLO